MWTIPDSRRSAERCFAEDGSRLSDYDVSDRIRIGIHEPVSLHYYTSAGSGGAGSGGEFGQSHAVSLSPAGGSQIVKTHNVRS